MFGIVVLPLAQKNIIRLSGRIENRRSKSDYNAKKTHSSLLLGNYVETLSLLGIVLGIVEINQK